MKMAKLFCILALIAGLAAPVCAQDVERSATVTEISGKVDAKIGKADWAPAIVGAILKQGDAIRTAADSLAVVTLDEKEETATVEVKQNSMMTLAQLVANKKEGSKTTLLDLALGQILIKAKKLSSEKSKFEVKTPTSIVGVRGTTFQVTVEAVE